MVAGPVTVEVGTTGNRLGKDIHQGSRCAEEVADVHIAAAVVVVGQRR